MSRLKRSHYPLVKECLAQFLEGVDKHATADYAIVMSDGRHSVSPNRACHAGLSVHHRISKHEPTPIAVINSLQSGHHWWDITTKEAKLKIIDYLVKRSPWANAFVHKSPARIYKQGYFLLKADVPGHVMGGACVAARIMWEQANNLLFWERLVDAGIPESLAFYITFACSVGGGKVELGTTGPGHCVLSPSRTTLKGVRDFINNTPIGGYDEPYTLSGKYDGYSNNVWAGRGGKIFREYLREIPVKVSATKNPFATVGRSVKIEDAVEALKNHLPQMLRDIENA